MTLALEEKCSNGHIKDTELGCYVIVLEASSAGIFNIWSPQQWLWDINSYRVVRLNIFYDQTPKGLVQIIVVANCDHYLSPGLASA